MNTTGFEAVCSFILECISKINLLSTSLHKYCSNSSASVYPLSKTICLHVFESVCLKVSDLGVIHTKQLQTLMDILLKKTSGRTTPTSNKQRTSNLIWMDHKFKHSTCSHPYCSSNAYQSSVTAAHVHGHKSSFLHIREGVEHLLATPTGTLMG